MNRSELLQDVRDTLNRSGFYVSEICSMRPIGFDIVARRDNSLLIIKVLTNIDAISENVANELKTLSILLKGNPLLIGEHSGTGKLEDEAVYDRFGIQSINSKTLKTHLLEGAPLEVYAGPGGFYVNLNREKIIKIRQEQNYSIGSFARSLKVSRRTVQMYEDGMNASIEVALRIEDLLGTNITVPIDLFKQKTIKNKIKKEEIKKPTYQEFQKEIFNILIQLGYNIIPMERCPFEAVSQDKKKILLTSVNKYDKKLLKKARVISSISQITEKHAVLITDKNEIHKTNIEGTPLIIKKELKKARGPEELLELIIERIYNKEKK